MKKLTLLLLLLSLQLIIGSTHAKAQELKREADHVALRELRDKATAALNKQDIDTLSTLFTENFSFTTIDQTTLTSLAEMKAYYERMFKGPHAMVESLIYAPKSDIKTYFLSENVGYCYGSNEETYKLKTGRTSQLTSRWTATMVKNNGTWKVATLHAGINFLDNPVLQRQSQMKLIYGALGTIAGLIGGLIAARIVRKL